MEPDEDDRDQVLRDIRTALRFIALWSMVSALVLIAAMFGWVVLEIRPA